MAAGPSAPGLDDPRLLPFGNTTTAGQVRGRGAGARSSRWEPRVDLLDVQVNQDTASAEARS